jgi:hypothetical protein
MKTSTATAWIVACALGTLLIAVPASAAPAQAKAARQSAATAPVNINMATQGELETLPGVGVATAKKIIAGRPYTTTADLAKSGVSAKTITKLTPLVTVGTAPAPARAPSQDPAAVAPLPNPAPAQAAKKVTAPVADYLPPAAGMVWVNLETKVFHREGDRFYGKTKRGKYMTEADALKAGYREAKVSGQQKKH